MAVVSVFLHTEMDERNPTTAMSRIGKKYFGSGLANKVCPVIRNTGYTRNPVFVACKQYIGRRRTTKIVQTSLGICTAGLISIFHRWLFPFIGHMGIATSQGVIRDFAGPYYVSEDCMAFGTPTKYWQMNPTRARSCKGTQRDIWDQSVHDASEEYKTRIHNLCCDNCHSHVAMALNLMEYNGSRSWNMVKLCFLMLIHGKYVNPCGFVRTWLPFLIMAAIIIGLAVGLSA